MTRPPARLLLLLACLASLVVAAPATGAPPAREGGGYEVTDLGTLGGSASFALGIGEGGTVVGTSRTTGAFRPQLAFRWRDGEMTNLGSLPGSTFSRAFAINPRGWAVGEAFTPSPERSRAVMWRDDRVLDLGTLDGATGAVANDINARGRVTGTSGGSAFVWERGGMRPVGSLSSAPGATSRGNALADRGLVVGTARTDEQTSHAYLATPRGRDHELRDLGALGGPQAFSTALGVNDRAQVVGESIVAPGSGTYRAFRWERGQMTDLGSVRGLRHSRATDVNARGVVVGHASGFYSFPTLDGAAVLWDRDEAVDLNERIPTDSGWVLRSAEAIDDAGRIVGFGSFDGQTRAFLLTPDQGR